MSADHMSAAGRARGREARAMLSVDHPHVCSAYDYGSLDDGRLYRDGVAIGEDLGRLCDILSPLPQFKSVAR